MKRQILTSVASLLGLLALQVGPASAQYIPPGMPRVGVGNQPLLSPYLNLVRQGGLPGTTGTTGVTGVLPGSTDPAVNYFLGTIPEQQRRFNYNQVQSEIGRIDYSQRATAGSGEEVDQLLTPLRSTGHPAVFNNTGGYFANSRVANRPMQSGTYRPPSNPGAGSFGGGTGSYSGGAIRPALPH